MNPCWQQDLDQNGASGCSRLLLVRLLPKISYFLWSLCSSGLFIILLVSSPGFSCSSSILPRWSLHCFHPTWKSACQGFGGMWGFLVASFHVQVFEMIIPLFQWLLNGDTQLLTLPFASFVWLQRCEMHELLLSFRKQVPFIFLTSSLPAWSQSAADSSVWKKGVCGDAINEAVLNLITSFMGFMQMSTNLCFMSH